MSKVLKKEVSPLKFDTSSANIGCFIRAKSKQKPSDHDRCSSGCKPKRRNKNERSKQLEFHDKAFLESVVCKILNDADCQGITELIDSMVFPGSSTLEIDNCRETHVDYSEQEQINQIFMDFEPFNKTYPAPRGHLYGPHQELYRILPPHLLSDGRSGLAASE